MLRRESCLNLRIQTYQSTVNGNHERQVTYVNITLMFNWQTGAGHIKCWEVSPSASVHFAARVRMSGIWVDLQAVPYAGSSCSISRLKCCRLYHLARRPTVLVCGLFHLSVYVDMCVCVRACIHLFSSIITRPDTSRQQQVNNTHWQQAFCTV
jgi:hypothetical protein